MSCCPKVGTPEWALAGARGLLKAASAEHREAEPEIQRRREICRACTDRTGGQGRRFEGRMTTLSVCLVCVCNIAAKTSLKAESGGVCCAGKW